MTFGWGLGVTWLPAFQDPDQDQDQDQDQVPRLPDF